MKYIATTLHLQTIASFATMLLDDLKNMPHTEWIAEWYQPIFCTVWTVHIEKQTTARWRTGVKAVWWMQEWTCTYWQCKKRKTLRAFPYCEPNLAKLGLQTEPLQHIQQFKRSLCSSQKKAALIQRKATNYWRRPGLAFRGLIGIRSTLGSVVPLGNAMRWPDCDH